MHEVFCVDNETQDSFTVGVSDALPRLLAEEGQDRLVKFCRVHVKALFAAPTPAMRAIAELMGAGMIRQIFTDNVDNMLCKTGVAFERVRGSGVFNERHAVEFASPRLIVAGVAADRRQIIRQARAAKLDVIVVNPCKKVSPNVTHLDYSSCTIASSSGKRSAFLEKCGLTIIMATNSSVREFEHCRSVLLRVLKGLSNEQLDFQIFPDAKPIGELLLHVAGFEFLMVAGARFLAGSKPENDLWRKLKSGFAREAGFAPPKGYPLEFYQGILRKFKTHNSPFQQRAADGLQKGISHRRPHRPFARGRSQAQATHYQKIAAGVGTTFSDDGAEDDKGETDLVNLLQLHETYHRGQITLQKYLYARRRE